MNCSCPYCTAPFDHDVWGPDDEIEKLQNRIAELEESVAAMTSIGNLKKAAKAWEGVDDGGVWLTNLRGECENEQKNTSRITHASRGAGGLLPSDYQSKEVFQDEKGGVGMKWEHQLISDLLEYAKIYLDIPAIRNKEIAMLLEKAASAIMQQDGKITKMEDALKRIRDCDFVITLPDRMDAVRQIARDALE